MTVTDTSNRPIKFDKVSDGVYVVRGCAVPHGRETHWDSECNAHGHLGQVTRVKTTSAGIRGTVTENLWTATDQDEKALKGVGTAGSGYYLTRMDAAKDVLRAAAKAWAAR